MLHTNDEQTRANMISQRKRIYAINGSASVNSSNQRLIDNFVSMTLDWFDVTVLEDLKILPPFDPQRTSDEVPEIITLIRNNIAEADGVLICSPEYIFSIPSGLKNLLEWCVSTTIFTEKPTGLITASAQGVKGQEELQLIMSTLMASFTPETILLIQGVKGKVNAAGDITDAQTKEALIRFVEAFRKQLSFQTINRSTDQ